MKKRLIDILVLSAILLTGLGISGGTVLSSYLNYQEYYKENYPEIDPTDYAKLIDYKASLKEGVSYYANHRAKPVASDFVLLGTFQPNNEEEPLFEAVINPEKRPIAISSPSTFSVKGGEVNITCDSITKTMNFALEKVRLDSLKVTARPYKIKYAVGEKFDPSGMEVYAVYNDGSSKRLTKQDYAVKESSGLTKQNTSITITYEEGGNYAHIEETIEVVDTLNDGSIVSLMPLKSTYEIEDGQKVKNVEAEILGVYESGNRKLLAQSDLLLMVPSETARLGKAYSLTYAIRNNHRIKVDIPVTVKRHFEGEDCIISGGETNTEPEYRYVDGALVKDEEVTFAGGFAKAVEKGKDGSIKFTFVSYGEAFGRLNLRCANSYLEQIDEQYYMAPLQINTIAELLVNNKAINIPDSVMLSGCGPSAEYEPLYNVYSDFSFLDLPLVPGDNTIAIRFKKSSEGALTYWNESPSTMNIDSLELSSVGDPIEEGDEVTSLSFQNNFALHYGDDLDTIPLPIIAEYASGKHILVTEEEVSIDRPTGKVGLGELKISAALRSNPDISVSKTFHIGDVILQAESAKKSGSSKVTSATEAEYSYEDQSETNVATVIKGMDNSATNYSGETSLSFSFAGVAGKTGLIVRCDNAYFFDSPYRTEAINLEQCVDIQVNGVPLSFGVALPSIASATNPDVCWMTLFELRLPDINLRDGENVIKIIAKKDAPRNKWNECSIPRFDYIKLTLPLGE